MTALLTANRCPACQVDHDHGPPGWPRCPAHGHYLYVLRGPLKTATAAGGDWAYACQGYDTPPGGRSRKCGYMITLKEKAIMTSPDTTALAIRQDQQTWTPQQSAAFAQIGIDGASDADLQVFLHRCQVTGLDPFSGQISMVKRGGQWTIQTGIDGYRVIGARAAAREGVEVSYGPTTWYDAEENPHDRWVRDEPPAGAEVTLLARGKQYVGFARYKSFVKLKDGRPTGLWPVMPEHLLAKCAEVQAWRKAFPYDTEGIGTPDDDDREHAPRIVAEALPEPPQPPPVTGSRENIEAMRNAIGRHLSGRLGVTDVHERSAYVHNLANKQVGDDITDADVRTVYALLTEKEDGEYVIKDISALVELTSPDAEVVDEGEAP